MKMRLSKGNLMKYNGQIMTVTAIYDDDDIELNGGITTNEYDPIPLTPDELVKLGLIKTKVGTFLLGSYELMKSHKGWDVIVLRGKLCQLKYVHQLQNLYHALTGVELTYTP